MGRESSHGTKELFNLPPLVLKARHLSGSALLLGLGLPELAMGWLPLTCRFGIGIEDKPSEFSCARVQFGCYQRRQT